MARTTKRATLSITLLSAVVALSTVAGYPLQYCEAPLPEFVPIDESKYRLAQVTLVTRHGDRTPLTLMGHESDVTWDKCDYKEYQSRRTTRASATRKWSSRPMSTLLRYKKLVQPNHTATFSHTKSHHPFIYNKARHTANPVTHSHTLVSCVYGHSFFFLFAGALERELHERAADKARSRAALQDR